MSVPQPATLNNLPTYKLMYVPQPVPQPKLMYVPQPYAKLLEYLAGCTFRLSGELESSGQIWPRIYKDLSKKALALC